MSRDVKFWDKISARYARQPIADEAAYQEKLRVTRSYLQPHMQLLEFGCGTGSTAILHAPYVNHIHAVDISPKMIEIARSRAEAAGIENISFTATDIESLSVEDASFDMVLGLNILHLLGGWDDVIARVYRLLKPGGVFVSSTACLGDAMKYIKWIEPIGRLLGLMPFVAVFTTQQLQTSHAAAGFQIEYQWQPGKNKAVFIVAKKPVAQT